MTYIPAYDLYYNNIVNLQDFNQQAIHLILTTLYTPKGVIPNMVNVGASFYNYLSTLDFNYTLSDLQNDLTQTGIALNYDQNAITTAISYISNIDIQDAYIFETYDANNNIVQYITATAPPLNIENVKIVKMLTVTLSNSAQLNVFMY